MKKSWTLGEDWEGGREWTGVGGGGGGGDFRVSWSLTPRSKEIGSETSIYVQTCMFLDEVNNIAVIFLDYNSFTVRWREGFYFELLQHNIKFHYDLLRSVRENEQKALCFPPILWQSVKVKATKSYIKWYRSMMHAYKHIRHERDLLTEVHVAPVKLFATQDGQTDWRTNVTVYTDSSISRKD